jgi:hypothetical protein
VDELERLADLDEHLQRAREALAHVLEGPAEESPPARALDVARAAVARLGAFAGGLQRTFEDGSSIHLVRDGRGIRVAVSGAVTPADAAAFARELRLVDRCFLESAELLGLLLGLVARWVRAGFAPPLVLHSLAKSAPRILELADRFITPAGAEQSEADSSGK